MSDFSSTPILRNSRKSVLSSKATTDSRQRSASAHKNITPIKSRPSDASPLK